MQNHTTEPLAVTQRQWPQECPLNTWLLVLGVKLSCVLCMWSHCGLTLYVYSQYASAIYAITYLECTVCKSIPNMQHMQKTYKHMQYMQKIYTCKIVSMYVTSSIQGEAKSAALDRTPRHWHHLLGMQEGKNGPGRSCRRVCAGRHRRGSGQTGPLQSARGQRSPRTGPSSLDRPQASEWPP